MKAKASSLLYALTCVFFVCWLTAALAFMPEFAGLSRTTLVIAFFVLFVFFAGGHFLVTTDFENEPLFVRVDFGRELKAEYVASLLGTDECDVVVSENRRTDPQPYEDRVYCIVAFAYEETKHALHPVLSLRMAETENKIVGVKTIFFEGSAMQYLQMLRKNDKLWLASHYI